MSTLPRRDLLKVAGIGAAGLAWPAWFTGPAVAEPPAKESATHRTDWLHKARWGVMFHYCSRWKGLSEPRKWNKAIDAFDVTGLAEQLDEVGAGYFLITAKHCGNPIAPNSVYEKQHPGHCPQRDLIADLADELGKWDVKLMLYFATGGPPAAELSAQVIEEFSKRYGKKVKGWWLDNNPGKDELQKKLADACRAGNPDTLVAFSPPKGQRRNSKYEDYTAGNTHAPGYARCDGRWVDGLQWHMLSYLGHNWGGVSKYRGRPRWPVGKVVGFSRKFTSGGGAVTWDVPPLDSGLIHAAFIPYLSAVGDAVGTRKKK